jgi:UDP-glucose 4-epimerase
VLQVIDAVKKVSGSAFRVKLAARRPGDSPATVADATQIRDLLGWRPKFDDLGMIVRHALMWEQCTARDHGGTGLSKEL